MNDFRWPARRRSDGRDFATFRGRKLFLAAVAEHVPEAIGRLRAEPYQAFISALVTDPPQERELPRSKDTVFGHRVAGGTGEKVTLPGDSTLPAWTHLHWEPRTTAISEPGVTAPDRVGIRERPTWDLEAVDYPEGVGEFRDALWKWAGQQNLQDLWCLDVAQKTLREWYGVEHLGGLGDAPHGFADPDYVSPLTPPFQFHGFDPTLHNRKEWLASLLAAADQYIDSELRRLERENDTAARLHPLFPEADVDDSDIFRGLSMDHRSSEHFAWVAVYQVGEKSFDHIAEQFKMGYRGTGRANVTRKIREKAELIGLTLRK